MFEQLDKTTYFWRNKAIFWSLSGTYLVVSNIDSDDILQAIKYHKLKPAGVFTSEDTKSYKPRKELFEFALNNTGLAAEEVLHIGDSLSSDIKGASAIGINAIWINRSNKEVPKGVVAVKNLLEIYYTDYFN